MINKKYTYAEYKMIDYSKEDGNCFITIKHNISELEKIRLVLELRGNKKRQLNIPFVIYGNYIESSFKVDSIFSEIDVNENSIWEFVLLNGSKKVKIELDKFEKFMTDYYPLKKEFYIIKPYITGDKVLAFYRKQELDEFEVDSINVNAENFKISIKLNSKYIRDLSECIKNIDIHFRRRKSLKVVNGNYEYCALSSVIITKIDVKNDVIIIQGDFDECLRNQPIKEKTVFDSYIKVVDYNNTTIESVIEVKGNWKNSNYFNYSEDKKVCLFKNSMNALAICANIK